ncbi:uncharacterized protein MELLADRAFT_73133 [Melampsora larici-populina 98AG31]|uniref:Uncharacterized protein n=1 Tax=Melampsora larici-populina (strain 98AG31 / pathotype 3-4-7) TaxID=747676 RepID=F4S3N0_MELLP|nr:uncharacterized protein MELLADRAFT_73133 [Melampsora larici-populina 98AG31]EGG00768.1 hypothetical protein MELLADRAFT_73133 [Melampsora larici-populina 98AG31]
MIKEKAKHARENLHTVLLTGIKPDRGCQECTRSIPDLQTLVGLIIQLGKEEIESKLEGDIWKDTDMLSRTCFAYLRRECLRLYFPDKATSTIWIVVDNQLSYLLSKGRPYTTCFYNLIYQQDRKKFDSGSVMYDDIPIAE